MRGTDSTSPTSRRSVDDGFTLVEVLIVIVILGILAVVTVFAVRGITDRGEENSEAADLKTLETAAEAYWAEHATNAPDEATLVAQGLLKAESTMHEYALNGDGSYTMTNVRTGADVAAGSAGGGGGGGGGGAPEPDFVVQPTTYAGYGALRYGQGAKTLVFLTSGHPQAEAEYNAWVAGNTPIPDTQFIFINDPGFTDHLHVEDAIAQNATAYVAAYDFTYRWTTTGAPQVPIWWIRGGGVGAFGVFRSPGLGNVIQWDAGTESITVVANNFIANY